MEDISRELEKEIALTKPKPYKQDRKTRILIVDDFGKYKSGAYLKNLLMVLSVVSVFCFVAAVLLFFLYSGLSGDSKTNRTQLMAAEKKVQELTREKEVLMARLVIMGKEPGIDEVTGQELAEVDPEITEKKPLVQKKPDHNSLPEVRTNTGSEPAVSSKKPDTSEVQPEEESVKPGKISGEKPESETVGENSSTDAAPPKKVSIEKFTVVKDGNNGDLLVRFDIRNVSSSPGDVSGRIFTILKPETGGQDQWLVVPSSKLENDVPNEYRKGQYFSIAHFKPVKFRIKNQASPDFFKKASIYIFASEGVLMFEKHINITEAE